MTHFYPHTHNHFLRQLGADSGSPNASVNGSVTPKEFYWVHNEPSTVLEVSELVVFIEDDNLFQTDDYGAVPGPLTNGIEVKMTSNGEVVDLLDGVPITSNSHFLRHAFTPESGAVGGGNNHVSHTLRYGDFNHIDIGVRNGARYGVLTGGTPVILSPGDRFSVWVNDDLTTLFDHSFLIRCKTTWIGEWYVRPRSA